MTYFYKKIAKIEKTNSVSVSGIYSKIVAIVDTAQ